MTATILDGKALAASVRGSLKERIAANLDAGLPRPGLATVLVGGDPASQVYVKFKRRACEEVGIHGIHIDLPADCSREQLLDAIADLNADATVHGILVQLPLPDGLPEAEILAAIDPAKDADGFHPVNQGRLLLGEPSPRPCTPQGIMRILDHASIELLGKRAVVVGRSNIVGKPIALMLLERHATVTLCHSRTVDLEAEVRAADIVVAAVGRAGMIRGEWLKPGAAVIDVGINRVEDGSLVGDVEFTTAVERAGAITPVPGGVGPMTIAMLLENTVLLSEPPPSVGQARK